MKYTPNEIIFAATEACNLHCPHCFVSRNPCNLDVDQAMAFIDSCIDGAEKNPELPKLEKIGFSGGEPFLYFDFIVSLTNQVVERELMFDQIMTNGDWWKDVDDLEMKLQVLYEAGYDGHFGLSWDIFHGQKTERIITFISKVIEIFGPGMLNIQTVVPNKALFKKSSPDFIDKKAYKQQLKDMKQVQKEFGLTVYELEQSFPGDHDLAWSGKKWFTEDFCEGPGHVMYIHPTGDIAPCCGFANENQALFIGKITDSFETVMENAEKNKMVSLCYKEGLSSLINSNNSPNYPGKCPDICSFCDYICKGKTNV